MYFSAATNSYLAVNCDNNSYGVGNITGGLAANPCRECPIGMHTSRDIPANGAYWASDAAGKQGFTSPLACVTKPGFGFNGLSAVKCPVGYCNPPGNYQPCRRCPVGLSTPDDAASQVSQDNCTLGPGYGLHGNRIIECPVGE